jgi:single-strand DNA-binding protein
MIVATVTGNVGQKPELRESQGGKKMASFSVASSYKREGRDNHTTWVDVLAFDEMAERLAAEVEKGDRLVVTGRLSLESFVKRDGTQGWALKMVADEVGVSLRWHRKERYAHAGAPEDDEPLNF